MTLFKKAALATTMLASFPVAAAYAAPIVYTGSQQVGTISATYSITTNGSLGALTSSSITDFNVLLTGPMTSVTITHITGDDIGNFSATATGLSIDLNSLNFETSFSGSLAFRPDSTVARLFNRTTGQYDQQVASASNNSVFATAVIGGAVPEPATWAMMMLGFGGMGYAMRRKAKVSTRIRFA